MFERSISSGASVPFPLVLALPLALCVEATPHAPGAQDDCRYGESFHRSRRASQADDSAVRASLRRALDWLRRQQLEDGSWGAGEGTEGARERTAAHRAGGARSDVDVTALALLAFLGDGSTLHRGRDRDVVERATHWLLRAQDPRSGRFGDRFDRSGAKGHALATLAICDAHFFSSSADVERAARAAVGHVLRTQSASGAWREARTADAGGGGRPPASREFGGRLPEQGGAGERSSGTELVDHGAAGVEVTGWMLQALITADEVGVEVAPDAFARALAWFDRATDPLVGRGGSASPVAPRPRDWHLAADGARLGSDALIAAHLACRLRLGHEPVLEPSLYGLAEWLLEHPPSRAADARDIDLDYWYHGSCALHWFGGESRRAWNDALVTAVLQEQRGEGQFAGSWDSIPPSADPAERVRATALTALCLQARDAYVR